VERKIKLVELLNEGKRKKAKAFYGKHSRREKIKGKHVNERVLQVVKDIGEEKPGPAPAREKTNVVVNGWGGEKGTGRVNSALRGKEE